MSSIVTTDASQREVAHSFSYIDASIVVRPIIVSDKELWLKLFKAYIAFYKSELTPEQYELTWQRINSDFNINGLIAEKDGVVAGIAHYLFRPSTWAVEDYCYLEDLYVDPAARGSGVGRALINRLVEISSARGSKRLYWTTAPDNAVARKLYDSVAVTDRIQYKIYLH